MIIMKTKDKKPYIALLRGVMPTGKNRIPKMAELQELLSSEFEGVRTYIQSGNIVFLSDKIRNEIAPKVSQLIKEHIGPDLPTVVATRKEVQEMLDMNPFIGEAPDLVEKIQKETFDGEELAIVGDKIYLYLPKDASRSKLNNNYVEKRLKIVATTRNFNTLSKLITMVDELTKE